jgi:hypothetical protein
MRTSIITTAAAIAGAAFLISASLVSASIEPATGVQVLHSNTMAKGDRLDNPSSAKGDRLPIATMNVGSKVLVVAYRTGPGASTAVLF